MSVFIRGLFACSVGLLKLRVRISSFGHHLLSWRSITDPNFKPGGRTSPGITRGAYALIILPLKCQRSPYEGLITHCITVGSQGFLVVKLVVPIQPIMVTLEHLDKKIDRYSKNDYKMAPKYCEVFGWEDENGVKKVRTKLKWVAILWFNLQLVWGSWFLWMFRCPPKITDGSHSSQREIN